LIGIGLVAYSIWGFISLFIAEGWYSTNQGAFYNVLIGSIIMLIFGGGFIQLGLKKKKKKKQPISVKNQSKTIKKHNKLRNWTCLKRGFSFAFCSFGGL